MLLKKIDHNYLKIVGYPECLLSVLVILESFHRIFWMLLRVFPILPVKVLHAWTRMIDQCLCPGLWLKNYLLASQAMLALQVWYLPPRITNVMQCSFLFVENWVNLLYKTGHQKLLIPFPRCLFRSQRRRRANPPQRNWMWNLSLPAAVRLQKQKQQWLNFEQTFFRVATTVFFFTVFFFPSLPLKAKEPWNWSVTFKYSYNQSDLGVNQSYW